MEIRAALGLYARIGRTRTGPAADAITDMAPAMGRVITRLMAELTPTSAPLDARRTGPLRRIQKTWTGELKSGESPLRNVAAVVVFALITPTRASLSSRGHAETPAAILTITRGSRDTAADTPLGPFGAGPPSRARKCTPSICDA